MSQLSPLYRATRPLRRYLLTALGGFVIWAHLKLSFHQPPELQALIGLGLLLPLLHCSVLAGTLHELMHRNSFPQLPRAGARLRKLFWLEAAALSALGLVGSWLTAPELPLAAVAGVLALASALPLLNPRSRPFYHGTINPWFPLLLCAVGLLSLRYPGAFKNLVCLQPWLTLLAGALGAGLILHHCFTRRSLLARLQTPFISLQNLVHFNPSEAKVFSQHLSNEIIRSNGPAQGTYQRKLNFRGNRLSTLWWHDLMASAHSSSHRLVGNSRGALPRMALRFFLVAAAGFGIACLLGFYSPATTADRILAYAKGANDKASEAMLPNAFPLQMLIAMPFMIAMMSLPALRLRPRLLFPVSRQTMLRCIQRSTLVNSLWASALPLSIIPVIIACALWRQEPLGFWVAQRMLTLSLLFAPLSLLLACASLSEKAWLNSLSPFLFLGLFIFLLTISTPTGRTPLLGGSTLALCSLFLSLASFLLFRRLLRARYLRGDLLGELNPAG